METDIIYCKKCERYRGCYKKDGVWICCVCKREVKNKEEEVKKVLDYELKK